MTGYEEKEVLESFRILIDTREQDTEKAKWRYKHLSAPYVKVPLNYGDYTYNATLPSGKSLHDEGTTVSGNIVIERKMSIDELVSNFTRGRERFKREFNRAREHDARIILLIENGSWEKILSHKYKSRMHPHALTASINAYMIRYNCNIVFCREESSPILIRDILYRDLKERIERGDFDEETTRTQTCPRR